MRTWGFLFFAVADLTVAEAVVVMACFAMSSLAAVVVVLRRMARNDEAARWPVSPSPDVDPE